MIKVFTGILYDFVMNNLKNDSACDLFDASPRYAPYHPGERDPDKSPSYFHKTCSQHL